MDEITLLKNEIEKLNTIISALAKEVGQLRRENESLKNAHSLPDEEHTRDKNKYGINSDERAISENIIGISTEKHTINNSNYGINSEKDTIVENKTGINTTENTIDKNKSGINSEKSSIRGNISGINTEKINISDYYLPPIDVSEGIAIGLERGLHKHLPARTHHGRVSNIARQLIFIHNRGEADGPSIRAAGGYSVPGFAKHLPKLKRDGFIRKGKPGKYILTEKSKQILYEAYADLLIKK